MHLPTDDLAALDTYEQEEIIELSFDSRRQAGDTPAVNPVGRWPWGGGKFGAPYLPGKRPRRLARFFLQCRQSFRQAPVARSIFQVR